MLDRNRKERNSTFGVKHSDKVGFFYLTGISILLVRRRKNTPPSARLVSFFTFVPTAKTLSSQQVLCPGQKAMTWLISNPFHGHLPRQLPSVVQIGFALLPRLPGWQRQTLHPPQHAS